MKKQVLTWVKGCIILAALGLFVALVVHNYPTLMYIISGKSPYLTIDEDKTYIGLYSNNPYALKDFKVKPQALGWFQDLGYISDNKLALALDKHAYIPFITLEPESYSLEEIVAGDADVALTKFFHALSEGSRKKSGVFVRFAHEMEPPPGGKSWYRWQGKDPSLYVAAWKHVVELGRSLAPNVKYVWSPDKLTSLAYPYYPGDEWVDYVSCTFNNRGGKFSTFAEFAAAWNFEHEVAQYDKPYIISECAEMVVDVDKSARYIESVFSYIASHDNVKGAIFFDHNTSADRMYEFTSFPELVSTFEQGIEAIDHE